MKASLDLYQYVKISEIEYFRLLLYAAKRGKWTKRYLLLQEKPATVDIDSLVKQGHITKSTDPYGETQYRVARIKDGELCPIKEQRPADAALSKLKQQHKEDYPERLAREYADKIRRALRSKRKAAPQKELMAFLQKAHDELRLPLYDLSLMTERGLVRNRNAAMASLGKAIHAHSEDLERLLRATLWCLDPENWLQLQKKDPKLGRFQISLLANMAVVQKVEQRFE